MLFHTLTCLNLMISLHSEWNDFLFIAKEAEVWNGMPTAMNRRARLSSFEGVHSSTAQEQHSGRMLLHWQYPSGDSCPVILYFWLFVSLTSLCISRPFHLASLCSLELRSFALDNGSLNICTWTFAFSLRLQSKSTSRNIWNPNIFHAWVLYLAPIASNECEFRPV